MAQNSNSSGSTSNIWDRVVDACPNFLGVAVATAGQTLTDVANGVIGTLAGHGMEMADKLDARAAETMKFLDSAASGIVDWLPNAAGVTAATAFTSVSKVTLQFGQGLADSARLGSGFAQGTAGGVVKDVLRALPIVSPAMSTLQELRFARLARVYIDPAPELGACLPVTLAKALRQVGQGRAFATLDEMISGLARSPVGRASLDEGRYLREMVKDLRRIGADFEYAQTGGSLERLGEVLRAKPNGVVAFSAQWRQAGAAEDVAHAMYAFIDKLGKLRIADRSGAIVNSLGELESSYPGISSAILQTSAMYIPKARYMLTAQNAGAVGLLLNIVGARGKANPVPQSGNTRFR